MSVTPLAAHESQFMIEAGVWFTLLRLHPELDTLPAGDLLQRTQRELVVPLRFGRGAQGVALVGECPLQSQDEPSWEDAAAEDGDTRKIAQRTLQHWLQGASEPNIPLDVEAVETVLGEADCEWARREEEWIVPAGTPSPVELRVTRVPRGLRVEGVLGYGDEYDPLTRRALAEFLCRVQLSLRFARVELHEKVSVVAEVGARSIHGNFRHSLGSVAQACRLLADEVRALAAPELAHAYLSVVCGDSVQNNDLPGGGV